MGRILKYLNLFILFFLIGLNFLGVFLPELGFDALWYHLPLAKLLLSKGQWYFPGGLYYYSAMPRLAELISLPFFAVSGYHGPKLVQFLSGLVVIYLIFKLAKRFTGNTLHSLAAVNLFYATWLVSWQSSSGYVDLVRTAFEIGALYFLVARPSRSGKLGAGLLFGLAIGTKWHALGSLLLAAVVFSPAIVIPALLIAAPWFAVAFHFTGNPLYPLFEPFMSATQLAQVSRNFYAPFSIASRFLSAPIFLIKPSEDLLSPIAGLVYLFSLFGLVSGDGKIRRLALYGVLGTFLLLLTPPPSTRYFLPYFPAMILAAIHILSRLKEGIANFIIIVFALGSLAVLSLRLGSYYKYLPYLTGRQNLNQFLTSLSARLPSAFIDSDGYVAQNLPADGSYLIRNLHNLYYFPYDFDHESFAQPDKRYDYLIATGLDPAGVAGELIHTNELGIQIFKL